MSGGDSLLHCEGFSSQWPVAEHRLYAHGLQQLQLLCVVARGLESTGLVITAHRLSFSVAHGIFLDQGLNPRPLHRQVDSYPLHHQGSQALSFLIYRNDLPLWSGTGTEVKTP